MVDAVNSVAGMSGADAAALVRAPAAATKQAAAEDTAPLAEKLTQAQPISPRLVFDPGAGAMVTEFVGKDGKVTAQVPSTAALAYMRAGLDANGQRHETHEPIAKA